MTDEQSPKPTSYLVEASTYENLIAERDALRAELAAEREERDNSVNRGVKIIEEIAAERDALRDELAATRAAVIEECAAAVRARYMGDNNREDAEVLRCVETILALAKGDGSE